MHLFVHSTIYGEKTTNFPMSIYEKKSTMCSLESPSKILHNFLLFLNVGKAE